MVPEPILRCRKILVVANLRLERECFHPPGLVHLHEIQAAILAPDQCDEPTSCQGFSSVFPFQEAVNKFGLCWRPYGSMCGDTSGESSDEKTAKQ